MKTQIVRIGNSQGIRIPKPLLELTGLAGEVEILADNDSLVIRPVKRPRQDWAAAFEEMARRGDDVVIERVGPNELLRKKKTLAELVAGITPENLHGEWDTGPDVGKEVV